jgi:glycosyltransferase involved in cell wall biosynthesis
MHILIPALHRPSKPTGVCRHAVNLAQCLAETNEVNKLTLIVGEWQKSYFEETFKLLSSKIDLIGVFIKNNSLSRNRWFLFGLPKLANRLQPDIIHMSFPFPFIRQWFKAPVVATIHDLYPYECPENFGYPQVWFNRWFLRQCVDNSDGLACVSKSTLQSLKHYFPSIERHKKITTIYNYVDFGQTTPKIAFEDNFPFLLCVAQHRKNKNLDLLIQSYVLLLKNGRLIPSTKLVLVGSPGPETENIQNLIESLTLQERVVWLSSLDDEELCWLYKKCELFVIPSSTEGFCLPLVEALSFSCKTVCSDIPIFREVGSSNCIYFDLKDNPVENLAHAIAYALSQTNPSRLLADPRFSKSHVAQQLLNFYASVKSFQFF